MTMDNDKTIKPSKDNKKYFLGKLSLNWADEIDFVFFDVFEEDEKKELISKLHKLGNDEITLCFGTNEDADYSGNDLLESIEWIKIPDDATRKFLENKVCDYDNSINHILESLCDDDEDFEDEDDEDFEDEDDETEEENI